MTLSTGVGPVKVYWCRGSHSLALNLASITGMGGEGKKKKKNEKREKKNLPRGASFLVIKTTTIYPCLV